MLLVLNVIAVAGFVTFWARCNSRTVRAAGQDFAADARRYARYNLTAQASSVSHETLLKRLGSLEDVVYRQLNGKFTLSVTEVLDLYIQSRVNRLILVKHHLQVALLLLLKFYNVPHEQS